jgi:hypothetical protein
MCRLAARSAKSRRRGEVQHQPRAGAGEIADGVERVVVLVDPCVLADREAERLVADLGQRPTFLRRDEVAVLVEHVVGGQQGLGLRDAAGSPLEEDGRVRELLAASARDRERRAERDGDVARGRGQGVELGQLIAYEAVPFEQVERRVACQGEFGQDDQLGAEPRCALRRLLDQAPISGKVADRGVHLGKSDLHGCPGSA